MALYQWNCMLEPIVNSHSYCLSFLEIKIENNVLSIAFKLFRIESDPRAIQVNRCKLITDCLRLFGNANLLSLDIFVVGGDLINFYCQFHHVFSLLLPALLSLCVQISDFPKAIP